MNSVISKLALKFGLVALVLSSLYVVTFGYDSAAIPLHVISIVLYSAACFSFCLLLLQIFKEKIAVRIVIFTIGLCYLLILSAIYLSSFLSSYFWSEPMYDSLLINSISLLIEYYSAYIPHIFEIIVLIITGSASESGAGLMLYSLTAGLFIFPVMCIASLWVCRRIYNQLLAAHHLCSRVSRSTREWLLTLSLAIITQIGFIALYAEYNWRGELLIDTFFSESYLPFTEPYRVRLAAKDREFFKTQAVIHGNGQNIVLIIVDAMRGDYVYDKNNPPPFLSRLIAEKKLQTQDFAYSTCSYSLCGIMGIISSKNVNELNSNNVKLQELFKKSGYQTYSIMAGFPDWYGMKDLYQKTYDTYIDSDISPHETHLDDLITDNLSQLDIQEKQPFFLYLRLMSTHEYGRLKPEFMSISRYEYANRVLQADDYLRQIFSILEQKGLLQNTTILITGDHGHSQGEKHEYGHNLSLYHNQLHIPIMIYDEKMHYPKLKLASSLDVAPTLIDRAGLPSASFFNGTSILKNNDGDRMLFHSKAGARYQTDRMRAVTYKHGDKIYKYIYTGAKKFSASPHKEEIFEITADPEEEHNLIGSIDPEILTMVKNAYTNHFRD
jgi:glucan phosphoethanolaminetransferase (alkaline phosphatase superfamily)